MRGAELLYKCRNCGLVFASGLHAPDGQTVLMCNITGRPLPEQWGPQGLGYETTIHCCSDEVQAIADFAGVKYDNKTGK